MLTDVTAFAPATVANVGIGFDILGHTVEALGDKVRLRRTDEPGVRIRSITGVTDSSGSDTWTRAVADNPSTRIGAEVWYVANAPAGITLVTASFSTPVNAVLRVYEIQGAPANPLDQVHAAAGSGTSVSSGPTSTTSGSNDILVATVGFVSTSATISGLTSGFSNDLLVRNSLTNFNSSEQAGHEIVTSTGAYSYGGTLSGSQAWAAAIAAFE